MKLPTRGGLLLVSLLFGAARLLAGRAEGTLEFYWIDVEGGAATLIVTPAGESVLIDSGNPGGRDPGRIAAAARAAGLDHIDHYITTHFHADHFGGAAELAAALPLRNIYDNGIPGNAATSDPRWPQLIEAYAAIPGTRHVSRAGLEIPLRQTADRPSLALTCLGARQEFVPAPAGTPKNPLAADLKTKTIPPSDNDNSSVWLLEYGGFRFLNAGDLTWNLEGALVTPVNRAGEVDVYLTSHHGRDDSNNPVFIHSLAPTVAIMNNGVLKGAMPDAVAGLKSSPGIQAIYQLHKNHRPGEAANNTTDEFIANLGADPNACAGNLVEMTVAVEGRTYTVRIPSTGHARTYAVRAK
jgi:hypothetical protein